MKKFLIGFFLAFSIFLVPRSVSAYSSFDVPGGSVTNNSSDLSSVRSSLISLFERSNLDYNDFYVFATGDYPSLNVYAFNKNGSTFNSSYNGSTYLCFKDSLYYQVYSSDLSSAYFSSYDNTGYLVSCLVALSNGFCYGQVPDFGNGSLFNEPVLPSSFFFFSDLQPSFSPDYLTGFVTGFDYSTEAFVQWLIDTGKYQELPSYIGLSKLVSFIDFYKQWGSSNKLFVVKIVEWMMHFNIGTQTLENRNVLKATIDRLYQEYCNSSYVTFKSNSANQVHHRNTINTKTDDTDLTLVTDDPSDDTITSILRDILRGVIAIPISIYNNSQSIIAKLDSLNWTVNIANDGGSSSGSDLTPVLDKMDDIIEALGSDTVSVEIDQITKDDTDDFFDDWNLQFSSALNNKFPVASQLRTFFTGFFERCGIDADSDGEVYQYYNPSPLRAGSSSSSSEEETIVNDFLNNFGDADPSFLDDASFHGVPDLSVSVGGQSVSIIDFRVYAKYRDKIHFIISFVIWTLYLLHLYKALPSIIGQVADVATKTSEL